MNGSIIRYILGTIIRFMGIFLLFPVIVAFIYKEDVWIYYLIVALVCQLIGFINSRYKPKDNVFYLKEGCVATGLSWIILSIIGALPVCLSKEIPSYVDALFEIISGFTTTGASILSDVEALSHATIFWRSFTHLVGGMGVLVFLLAVIPLSGGSNMNLMRAESPGPSVGKLMPKVSGTARVLYLIYLGMTFIEFVLLLIGGTPVFTAINTAMATAGTGGFGMYNDSLTSFTMYEQWVVTIFMVLFGINFNAYYLILFGRIKDALKMEELRAYLGILVASTLIIFLNILKGCNGIADALTQAAFQVASISSSTGFSTADFAQWPQTSRTILVLLMFTGACAGSTGGGIKVSRFVMLMKNVRKELSTYIHPRRITRLTMDGKEIGRDVLHSTNVYFGTFIILFAISVFCLSFENLDFATNVTAVAATMNNIGPGMSMVGPTCNFSFYSNFSKLVLMFDMLAGRLELYPILMLFHPKIWQSAYISIKKQHS